MKFVFTAHTQKHKSLLHSTGIANTHGFATKPAPTNSSKYIPQENVNSTSFFARVTGNGGYPDLIGGPPECPGFEKMPTKFDVYRWDGKKYKIYQHNQSYLKTDKSIEEVISPSYPEYD